MKGIFRTLMAVAVMLVTQVAGSAAPASAAGPSWWNVSWTQRAAINIKANDSLPAGYQVSVTIDHAAMMGTGSRADGADVRIVHWNGAGWDAEQDRVVAVGSSWGSGTTRLYFKTASPITAGATDSSYYLYWGNASPPAALANGDNVYEFYDDFNSGPLNASKWSTNIRVSGSLSVVNGELVNAGVTDSNMCGNVLESNAIVTSTNGLIVESDLTIRSSTEKDWGASLGLGNYDTGIYIDNWNVPGTDVGYSKASDGSWVNMTHVAPSVLGATTFPYHRVGHAITAAGMVREFHDGTLVAYGGPALSYNDVLSFEVDPYAPGATYSAAYDNIVARKFVDNEPTVTADLLIKSNTVQASLEVLPTFTFTVAGTSSTCNGITPTGTSSATAVSLGRVQGAATVSGAQQLTVTSNAANGFVIYVAGASLSGVRSIAGVAGTNASPAVFGSGERFGYTTDDSDLSRFAGPLWSAMSPTPSPVMAKLSGSATNESDCLAYQFAATAQTPAGAYSTTVTYSAVPTF